MKVAAMPQLILDASVCGKLNNLMCAVEIRDPSGRVLGRFVPLLDMSEWEPLSTDISDDELKRRAKSNEPRYTTAQILAHLEKLRCSESRVGASLKPE